MNEDLRPFGLAKMKREGEQIAFETLNGRDPTMKRERTVWLEIPLTKAEYIELADELESHSNVKFRQLARELRQTVREQF